MPLRWINRDGKLIVLARGVRTFAQGAIAVILGIYLNQLGFSVLQIGLFISAGLAGATFLAILVGTVGDRLGRRRLLLLFPLMSAVVAVIVVLTDNYALLVAAAFAGAFVTEGVGASATHPLELASLAETTAPERRTDLYAVFNISRTVGAALGALTSGLPDLYRAPLGLSEVDALKVMFLGYALLTTSAALLYLLLSPAVEVATTTDRWNNPLRLPSRRVIFTLSGLFSVDHFASGLLMHSLMSLWFFTRFGIGLAPLGFIFSGSNIITAVSLWISAKLAHRIGLLNTMVYTHGFAALVTILVPIFPAAWMAVAAWQIRAFFGQMDIPARDSYTMALVGPAERTAMASMNTIGRGVAQSISPSVATALWSAVSSGVPLVGSGILRLTYDLALYKMFRNIKPPEEVLRQVDEQPTMPRTESG